VAGLDPAAPPNAEHHLPAETYYDVWERAMQLVQDPSFPVRVGASFDLEALEAFGFLAMSCETLKDAYERTARVRSLYKRGLALGARGPGRFHAHDLDALARQGALRAGAPQRQRISGGRDAGQRAREAFSSDPAFTALVRQRLAASMEGGVLGMAEVARSLGTSPRSLHRRLADEGTSFNDLLDEVRRQFAEQYLARPRPKIAEVAYLVGFNDPSAFFKAFRRWTGVTPSEYRHSLPSEAG